jgi:hypothetical protein
MLGKWPNPNKLSEMSAWAEGIWIGESWFEPRRGNWKALHHSGDVEPSSVFARCYRFSHVFCGAPAVRRLISLTRDPMTSNMVASPACW